MQEIEKQPDISKLGNHPNPVDLTNIEEEYAGLSNDDDVPTHPMSDENDDEVPTHPISDEEEIFYKPPSSRKKPKSPEQKATLPKAPLK